MNKIQKILLSTILISLFLFSNNYIYSQENKSNNASESAKVNTNEVREKLKERLEKANTDNILGTKTQSKLYAHFGIITEIGKSSFIIETADKKRVEVKLDEKSEISLYVGKGIPNKKITVEEIESGWFAIAMGTNFSEGSILALRISLSQDEIQNPQKRTIVGKVLEIEDTSITITNEQEVTIEIPDTYNLKIKGIDKSDLEDITLNDKIVAIVEITKNKEGKTIYSLKSMYVIPSIKNPKAEDNVVNEGTPSSESTKSAKSSPKPIKP